MSHGYITYHFSGIQQNVSSGDELSGIDSQFFYLLCSSLDELLKISKLEFLCP